MMIPMKKEGAEIPAILIKMEEVSSHVFCFTAAMTPSGMPASTAMIMAANAKSKVPGRASIRMVHTSLFDW
jgi:hypothetical protein